MRSAYVAKAMPALAAALALAACATGQRKPDVRLPATYEAPAGTQALSPQALDAWWTLFGDAELNDLEATALRQSPDAKTQIARLVEAGAVEKSGILQTWPTGGISGAASRKTTYPVGKVPPSLIPIGGRTENENADFRPTWELDFMGGLITERNALRDDYAATRFNVEGARAALMANVADSYFLARGLAIQLDDARENLRIETELYDVASKRAQHGIGAMSDADQVAGELAQRQSLVSNLEAQLHAARRSLLILIGRGVEPVENLKIIADVPDPPPLPEAVPGELLVRRPDVREADYRMRAAALRTRLAKEEVFPNIILQPAAGIARTVAPGVGVASIAPLILLPQQQSTSTGYWSYGASFTQPVLDIPRLLQDAKAQGARTEQAVIAYEKAVQTAYGDAENAFVELASDDQRLVILRDGEARARRAYDAHRLGYRAGIEDLTTALSAEETWRTDRSALTAQRVQALRRAVQLYNALGGGWAYEPQRTAAHTP